MTLQTCEYGSKRMNVMKKRERDRKREGERERERGGMHHEKLAKEKPFLIVGNLLWAQIPEAKNSENEKYWNILQSLNF